MKKIFFLLISSFSFAQNASEKEIVKPIENLFNAMISADSLGVKNAFSGSAIMQTFGKNQEIRTEKVEGFAKQVGSSKVGDLDERIIISKILIFKGLLIQEALILTKSLILYLKSIYHSL